MKVLRLAAAVAVITAGVFIAAAVAQEEREYTIKVTQSELQLVVDALNNLPRKVSNDLFTKIVSQFQAQVKAEANPPPNLPKTEEKPPVQEPNK